MPEPYRQPSPQPDNFAPWLVTKVFQAILLLAVFVVGMEIGYQRGARRQQATEPPGPVAALETDKSTPPAEKKQTRKDDEPAKVVAVKKEPEAPPKVAAKDSVLRFNEHILPILETKCVLCHGGKSTKGKLDLRTFAALRKGGSSGPGFEPGNVKSSTLWEYIADDRMPPGKIKLTAGEKRKIETWLTSGAEIKAAMAK